MICLSLPLIIHKDRTIYFYKDLVSSEEEIFISDYLKRTAMQVQYTDKMEVYKIEDFTIVSLILSEINSVIEFIKFLNQYCYNEIPAEVLQYIKRIDENMKVVSLTLEKTEIIIKVMKGDLSFLVNDRKINEKIRNGKAKGSYTYPREENRKLIEYLADKDVNMMFPIIEADGEVKFEPKDKMMLRYYQRQAFEALVNRKRGLVIAPVGSGKTYIAMQLIEHLKRTSLIICENKSNCYRWRDLLKRYLNITDVDISVCVDENGAKDINKVNIYSYDIIRTTEDESIFQRLFDNNWGVIIYDNAHKVVTDKAVDLLYLKGRYKFAFDSTLNRSNGQERSLLYLFSGITYNITSYELVNNMFQKRLECYKVDLRDIPLSREEFMKRTLSKFERENVIIAAYNINQMNRISKYLGIAVINTDTGDDERLELVKDFNAGKINRLCIGNLIEKYPITNIDVMIAAGYRGGTEIEENFRIGTLVSTPIQLNKVIVAKAFYLIKTDTDVRNVLSKERHLRKHGIFLKELDISKFLGDDNS